MVDKRQWNLRRTEDADQVFLIRQLNFLVEQEGNFLASYDLVLDLIDDADVKGTIAGFRKDHVRHIDELTEVVESMGGVPFEPDEPTDGFENEMEIMEEVDDAAVALAYFEIGERQSVWLYDSARSIADAPPEVNGILERALQDENRHHAWARSQLGTPERAEAGAARGTRR